MRSYNAGDIDDRFKPYCRIGRLTEKERDTETNYDYFGARYYDSELARWTTIDPLNQYYSPYTYCGNNPLRIIDRDGLYGKDVHHDLTYYMAVVVMGVDNETAAIIAQFNQYVDDNWETDSFNPNNWGENSLHFKSATSLKVLDNLSSNAMTMSDWEFGKSLHTFQDVNIAHKGYLPIGGPRIIGHLTALKSVDDVARNGVLKNTSIDMIKSVYELMKKRKNGKAQISYEQLIKTLTDYVKQKGNFYGIHNTVNNTSKDENHSNKKGWSSSVNRNWDQNWSPSIK